MNGTASDTEARHAEAEPIADDPVDLLTDARVIRVQVGLEVEEAVEVPLAYVLRVRPRRLLDTREHDSRSRVTRPLLRPHVPVAVRRVPAAAGVEEPRVTVRRVVYDKVENDADPTSLGVGHEICEVAARSEPRIDAVVVGYVVAVVAVRRRLRRREPDDIDAEALEIVETPAQPHEIADPSSFPSMNVSTDRL
jgi:hypothetical protein